MRVFITGIDGYLGWSLALKLAARQHDVGGMDCYLRRDWVAEVGSHSIIPIARMTDRGAAFYKRFGRPLRFYRGDLTDYNLLKNALRAFRPDVIAHLGEMPSAPYSMIDAQHCVWTHTNNMISTLNLLHIMRDDFPECHLLHIGTMGEYGTPDIDIPEGFFEVEYRGRKTTLPFPRQAGSWYHQTKVHNSHNIAFACRIWGLRATDIMQGVVYGTRTDEMIRNCPELYTRFDIDGMFGTAINRFCAQAVIHEPITPYGVGEQKRGFLTLEDSMQCLALGIENPPEAGEYRVFNQFEEVYTINQLANRVFAMASDCGLKPLIHALENPRMEAEEHYYNPDHQKLLDLGYNPTTNMDKELSRMIEDLSNHSDRILARKHVLNPDVQWSGERRPSRYR